MQSNREDASGSYSGVAVGGRTAYLTDSHRCRSSYLAILFVASPSSRCLQHELLVGSLVLKTSPRGSIFDLDSYCGSCIEQAWTHSHDRCMTNGCVSTKTSMRLLLHEHTYRRSQCDVQKALVLRPLDHILRNRRRTPLQLKFPFPSVGERSIPSSATSSLRSRTSS